MIQSFADRETERLFARERVRRFPADLLRAMTLVTLCGLLASALVIALLLL